MLEQTEKISSFRDKVSDLVSSGVTSISKGESKLLQRSTLQILDAASKYEIPIQCLQIDKTLQGVENNELVLEYGFGLPIMPSLNKIEVKTEKEEEISQEMMIRLFSYAQKCIKLKTLTLIDCYLPEPFPFDSLNDFMGESYINLIWRPFNYSFALNFTMRKWQITFDASKCNRQSLVEVFSKTVSLSNEKNKCQQRYFIILLENASQYKIPVACLTLDKCLKNANQCGVTLESGMCLPILQSLERLEIITKRGQIVEAEILLTLLRYGEQCLRLKKLSFCECTLPWCIVTKQDFLFQVTWHYLNFEFFLDSLSGKWTVIDPCTDTISGQNYQSLCDLCSKTLTLTKCEGEDFLKMMVMLLEQASDKQIPVSCLVLEKCFTPGEENAVTIMSDIKLPVVISLKQLTVKTEKSMELNRKDFLCVLRYGKQCHLSKVLFVDCVLPLAFPVDWLILLKISDMEVHWQPKKDTFALEFDTGQWVLVDSEEPLKIAVKNGMNLTHMCSKTMYLRSRYTKEEQRSVILLLEIASYHNIPIHYLYLEWCFGGFDKKGNIILTSGLLLPCLSSVEKISVNSSGEYANMTEAEFIGLIKYGLHSQTFNKLWFEHCKLPPCIRPSLIPKEAISRPVDVFSSNDAVHLFMQSGSWKKPESKEIQTRMCSAPVVITDASSEATQKSVIDLLNKAEDNDVPIYMVSLVRSYREVCEDGSILLRSGYVLPPLTSLERMEVQTETGRELTVPEVIKLLQYVQHSHRIKKLEILSCILPQTVAIETCLSSLKSRKVKVKWYPEVESMESYLLDLESGSFRNGESGQTLTDSQYTEGVARFRLRYKDTPWQRAKSSY